MFVLDLNIMSFYGSSSTMLVHFQFTLCVTVLGTVLGTNLEAIFTVL